ncbi:MAG: hypothetical protein IPJ34_03580 [Myxococcales bacterium]|nr:hypothetical protein [Myxococcales bacterium]
MVPIARTAPGPLTARLRASLVVCAALVSTGAAFTACSSEDPPAPPAGSDTGIGKDAGKADAVKDATSDSTSTDAGDTGGSTKPPPIEDTGLVEDFGTPVPGAHVEATIGPSGGTLEGTTGPLAGVKLVVPAGALSTATLLALDALASPGGPTGALVVSPFVRVGPETVLFSVPARLTLPWKSASADPQLAVVARSSASFTFSGLVEPVADATSITVSLGRGTGAEAITLSLTTTPSITATAPSTAAPGPSCSSRAPTSASRRSCDRSPTRGLCDPRSPSVGPWSSRRVGATRRSRCACPRATGAWSRSPRRVARARAAASRPDGSVRHAGRPSWLCSEDRLCSRVG